MNATNLHADVPMLAIDTDVLAKALSEVMSPDKAIRLAETSLAERESLPGLLASNSPVLTALGFDVASVDVVRQLGSEMRRSLARSFAGHSIHDTPSAFAEYVALSRAGLGPNEVRLFLFDATHALTADIACTGRDVEADSPAFRNVLSQARLARAHAYLLLYRTPATGSRAFINRLTTCCIAAGLVPFSSGSDEIGELRQRALSV